VTAIATRGVSTDHYIAAVGDSDRDAI